VPAWSLPRLLLPPLLLLVVLFLAPTPRPPLFLPEALPLPGSLLLPLPSSTCSCPWGPPALLLTTAAVAAAAAAAVVLSAVTPGFACRSRRVRREASEAAATNSSRTPVSVSYKQHNKHPNAPTAFLWSSTYAQCETAQLGGMAVRCWEKLEHTWACVWQRGVWPCADGV
jgi:hypothetical protein